MNIKIQKMVLVILVTLLTMFSSAIIYAHEIEVPEDIRIGLYYGSKSVKTLTLSSPGGIEVGVMVDGEFEFIDEVNPNEEIIVTRGSKKGSVEVEGIGEIGSTGEYPYFKALEDDDETIIEINDKKYRGNVEIRRFSDSDMTVINHLSMQEYLYGVVPREIGGNSPIEAIKAQAIVARTYATKNYGRRDGWGFDLYPTVDDQAYGGYEWENVNSNRAVDETDGQVVIYNGELIGGYYFSTSGGYTENSENVWGGKLDYLKAVPDYYEPEVEGNTTWEVELTATEIRNKLEAKGIYVGEVLEIEPVEYTDAGRVLELSVIGTDGETTLTKSKTREYLGLKSQWYTVNDEAPVVKEIDENDLPINKNEDETNDDWWMNDGTENEKDEEEYIVINPDYKEEENKVIEEKEMKPLLKSIIEKILGEKLDEEEETADEEENETKEDEIKEKVENDIVEKQVKYEASRSNTTFTFRGRGWGHAVGMSQNGAKGMAENGFSCEEIICWYYSGVEIID